MFVINVKKRNFDIFFPTMFCEGVTIQMKTKALRIIAHQTSVDVKPLASEISALKVTTFKYICRFWKEKESSNLQVNFV